MEERAPNGGAKEAHSANTEPQPATPTQPVIATPAAAVPAAAAAPTQQSPAAVIPTAATAEPTPPPAPPTAQEVTEPLPHVFIREEETFNLRINPVNAAAVDNKGISPAANTNPNSQSATAAQEAPVAVVQTAQTQPAPAAAIPPQPAPATATPVAAAQPAPATPQTPPAPATAIPVAATPSPAAATPDAGQKPRREAGIAEEREVIKRQAETAEKISQADIVEIRPSLDNIQAAQNEIASRSEQNINARKQFAEVDIKLREKENELLTQLPVETKPRPEAVGQERLGVQITNIDNRVRKLGELTNFYSQNGDGKSVQANQASETAVKLSGLLHKQYNNPTGMELSAAEKNDIKNYTSQLERYDNYNKQLISLNNSSINLMNAQTRYVEMQAKEFHAKNAIDERQDKLGRLTSERDTFKVLLAAKKDAKDTNNQTLMEQINEKQKNIDKLEIETAALQKVKQDIDSYLILAEADVREKSQANLVAERSATALAQQINPRPQRPLPDPIVRSSQQQQRSPTVTGDVPGSQNTGHPSRTESEFLKARANSAGERLNALGGVTKSSIQDGQYTITNEKNNINYTQTRNGVQSNNEDPKNLQAMAQDLAHLYVAKVKSGEIEPGKENIITLNASTPEKKAEFEKHLNIALNLEIAKNSRDLTGDKAAAVSNLLINGKQRDSTVTAQVGGPTPQAPAPIPPVTSPLRHGPQNQ